PLAERIIEELRSAPGVTHALVAGSLRRFSETIGDIDIIVTATAAEPVMQKLTGLSLVAHVLAHGEGKTSVLTRAGVQVDLRVVAEHQLGAALLYFTGSKGHNIKLRQRALGRGLTLNEYSLSELEGGRVVASETEASIYAALGLGYIPPTLREDFGELEASESGRLPPPLPPLNGDYHVHTSVSGDALSPLEDMVRAAQARGYRTLAITEHAEGTRAGVSREALLAQAEQIRAQQAVLGDQLRLLHGVELNIGPAGELDYDPEFRRGFAFCLASVHSHFELDRAAQTERILRAMHDPSVRMIGHLTGRNIGSRPGIELDLDAVLSAAERTGTALEINGALERLDLSVEALRSARQRRVPLVLTSDAHHERELGRIQYAALQAERAGVDPAQIVNTWPVPQLQDWLVSKRPL
ncbi:MAG: PHP domain-containing protein, partial [Deltaproteobacteria bacterium]